MISPLDFVDIMAIFNNNRTVFIAYFKELRSFAYRLHSIGIHNFINSEAT